MYRHPVTTNRIFPAITARRLTGGMYRLPFDLQQETLLALMPNHRQVLPLQSWKPAINALRQQYSLDYAELIVLPQAYTLARPFIDSEMLANVAESSDREHMLTCYTDLSMLAQSLGIFPLPPLTLLLLDSQGQVQWYATEDYDQQAFAELTQIVDGESKPL